jgi:hypothetical protein
VGRFILAITAVALHLYVLIDLTRSRSEDVRLLPRWLWFLVSLMPVVGPAAYLLAGQPRVGGAPDGGGGGGAGGIGGGPRPRGPVAPDDDPEFLKRLDEQSWAARMEQLRRQREAGRSGQSGLPPGDDAPGRQAPPPRRAPDEAPGEGATR